MYLPFFNFLLFTLRDVATKDTWRKWKKVSASRPQMWVKLCDIHTSWSRACLTSDLLFLIWTLSISQCSFLYVVSYCPEMMPSLLKVVLRFLLDTEPGFRPCMDCVWSSLLTIVLWPWKVNWMMNYAFISNITIFISISQCVFLYCLWKTDVAIFADFFSAFVYVQIYCTCLWVYCGYVYRQRKRCESA